MSKKYDVHDESGRKIGTAEEQPSAVGQALGAFILFWLIWQVIQGIFAILALVLGFFIENPKIGKPVAVAIVLIAAVYGVPRIFMSQNNRVSGNLLTTTTDTAPYSREINLNVSVKNDAWTAKFIWFQVTFQFTDGTTCTATSSLQQGSCSGCIWDYVPERTVKEFRPSFYCPDLDHSSNAMKAQVTSCELWVGDSNPRPYTDVEGKTVTSCLGH